jgi:hypothetical protein
MTGWSASRDRTHQVELSHARARDPFIRTPLEGAGTPSIREGAWDSLARNANALSASPAGAPNKSLTPSANSVLLEAGSHERSVRMKAADLVRLTWAQVDDISR